MSALTPQVKVVNPWLHPAGQTLELPGLPSICKKTDTFKILQTRGYLFSLNIKIICLSWNWKVELVLRWNIFPWHIKQFKLFSFDVFLWPNRVNLSPTLLSWCNKCLFFLPVIDMSPLSSQKVITASLEGRKKFEQQFVTFPESFVTSPEC